MLYEVITIERLLVEIDGVFHIAVFLVLLGEKLRDVRLVVIDLDQPLVYLVKGGIAFFLVAVGERSQGEPGFAEIEDSETEVFDDLGPVVVYEDIDEIYQGRIVEKLLGERDDARKIQGRITSYNVCYTKLLRYSAVYGSVSR